MEFLLEAGFVTIAAALKAVAKPGAYCDRDRRGWQRATQTRTRRLGSGGFASRPMNVTGGPALLTESAGRPP